MKGFKLFTLCIILPVALSTIGLPLNDMFPYGANTGDETVHYHGEFDFARLLDWYIEVDIPTNLPDFRIFGVNLGKKVFINFNGHFTFGARHGEFDPYTVNNTASSVSAIFNVFYSDNDIRRTDGSIKYRVSTNVNDLNKANSLIQQRNFVGFSASYCLIATWDRVKYYVNQDNDKNNPNTQQENTYQGILCTDGTNGHVIYQYQDMQWTISEDRATNPATIGWNVKGSVESWKFWAPSPSGTQTAHIGMAEGSNVGTRGRWMRSQAVVGPCVNQADGFYAVSCSQYRECCGQREQALNTCPVGSSYHSTLKMCIETRLFSCGGTNFCVGRTDGNHADTATTRDDDFYQCRSGVGVKSFCPHAITFGSSPRCR